MKKTVIRRYLRVGMLGLSLILLYSLLDHIGFNAIGSTFFSIGLKGALIIVCLGFAENLMDSLSFRESFQKSLPVTYVWSLNCAGAFMNILIPWEAGEVIKGTLLKKKLSASEAISGIIIWNYVHKISRPTVLLFIALLSALIDGNGFDYNMFFIIIGVIALSFIPFLIMHGLINMELSQKIVKVFAYFTKKDMDKILDKARELDVRVKTFRKESPGNFRKVYIFQFLARIIAWITFVICCRFMDVQLSFSQAGLLFCAVNLGAYILAVIPVKIGVGEGSGYVIFSFFGLDGGLGVMVTLALRIKALITTGLTALPVLKER